MGREQLKLEKWEPEQLEPEKLEREKLEPEKLEEEKKNNFFNGEMAQSDKYCYFKCK